jgi:HEAT repeat protein
MKLPRHPAVLLATALTLGCSSTSSGILDPSLEAEARARDAKAAETEARLAAPERLLTDLDKAMHNYTQFLRSGSSPRSETTAVKLHEYISQQATRNFDALLVESLRSEYPRNRAIAVAALGFSARPEALDPIVHAAQDENPEVVANAVFGLAMLADSRTPSGVVERVIRNEAFDETLRGGAAWTLHELQQVVVDNGPIIRFWSDLLGGPIDGQPADVLVSAIRGIGRSRDAAHLEVVSRYVSHPVPAVRYQVAIALGRFGSDAAVPTLLTLLGPAETNENVRLAARKGLQELAGGADRKYDVEEWKRVFDRGS